MKLDYKSAKITEEKRCYSESIGIKQDSEPA